MDRSSEDGNNDRTMGESDVEFVDVDRLHTCVGGDVRETLDFLKTIELTNLDCEAEK